MAENLLRFRDDEMHEEPAVTLEAFLGQSNATAVRVEAGEDVRLLAPMLDRLLLIDIAFPKFGDGRGYSAARILREDLGYAGELRASGDVLIDQLVLLRRCGFDSFAPDHPLDRELVDRTLERFAFVYQRAADERRPVWSLRHE